MTETELTERVDKIMQGMGFGQAADDGLFVHMLRTLIEEKVEKGMQAQYVSWTDSPTFTTSLMAPTQSLEPRFSAEDRARELLAMDWEIRQGHTRRVENIDPLWSWQTDLETWKRTLHIRWRRLPSWARDQVRRVAMQARVFWHRKVLKQVNPYLKTA